MKLIKSKPKYRCEYCRHQSTQKAMEKHERRCYKNPNRYCDYCKNKGETNEGVEEMVHMVECPYCVKAKEF